MKKTKLFTLLGTVFTLTACGGSVTSIRGATLLREPVKSKLFVTYNDDEYVTFKSKLRNFATKFTESFLNENFDGDTNIASSPLSLEMCLGLAIGSSNGETRQEILDAIGVDFNTFRTNYGKLYNEYNKVITNRNDKKMLELMMTNSIWIDDNVELLDDGLDTLRDTYHCYSYSTDFNKPNKANDAIAKFIELQTREMIKPKLNFSADTLFVLMNTLYVKDVWNSLGDELDYSLNPEHYFANSNKQKSEKKLLQGYYAAGRKIETENYSCFHTSTLNGLTLYFVKPNDGKELKSVFNKEAMDYVLGDNYVIQDDAKKERYLTRCIFPEFIADCDTNLKDLLYNDFDIKSIFDPYKCDFTNLSNDDKYDIYCSEVRHITKLDINKKGMEGAAVTIMSMDDAAAAPEPEQYMSIYEDFVVDKEFGFILTYNDSVLFSGVVNNIG